MEKNDIKAEVKKLRDQVAKLEKEKKAHEEKQEAEALKQSNDKSHSEGEEEFEGYEMYLKQILDMLGEDLKHTNPSTILLIFMLGLIVGRFMIK